MRHQKIKSDSEPWNSHLVPMCSILNIEWKALLSVYGQDHWDLFVWRAWGSSRAIFRNHDIWAIGVILVHLIHVSLFFQIIGPEEKEGIAKISHSNVGAEAGPGLPASQSTMLPIILIFFSKLGSSGLSTRDGFRGGRVSLEEEITQLGIYKSS